MFALFCLALLHSCTDKTEEIEIEPDIKISVDRTSLRLSALSGYTDSVTIQANSSWKINTIVAPWVTISPSEGNAGETVVRLTVTNDASSTRTETLSVSPPGSSTPGATITLEQKVYDVEWKKNFGGSNNELCESVIALGDGYLLIGATKSVDGDIENAIASNANVNNVYVVKVDLNGNKLWGKSFGSSLSDAGAAAVKSSDGGYYVGGLANKKDGDVAGNFHVGTNVSPDFWIIKLDADGNKLWDKCFGGTEYDVVYSMTAGPNGGVVVAGESSSTDGDLNGLPQTGSFLALSLDANGQIIWKKTLGTSPTDLYPVIISTSDHGYVIVGSSLVGTEPSDVLVTKINQNGEQLWTKTIAGSGEDLPWSVVEDNDQGIVITGHTFSSDGDFAGNNGNANIFVMKLSENGDMNWKKFYGGNGFDQGRAIAKADDGFFIAGITKSTEGDLTTAYGNYDYFVLKIDKDGRKMWQKSYGGSGIEQLWGAVSTSDNGVVVTGYSASTDHDIVNPKGGTDIFVIKIK